MRYAHTKTLEPLELVWESYAHAPPAPAKAKMAVTNAQQMASECSRRGWRIGRYITE